MTTPTTGTTTDRRTTADRTMRAIRFTRFGGPEVLRLSDVPVPIPADDQVLVRVHASSVNAVDWHRMRAKPHVARVSEGLRRPKDPRLGADVAGVVEAVGRDVRRFQMGDEVFGTTVGAFAEFAAVAEAGLVHKPANVTFEQAGATGVAGLTALQGLRDRGRLVEGQRVLINGAGGGVGSFGVQIGKALGAHVTAVTRAASVDAVRRWGADEVIDRARIDFTRAGTRWDVILDVSADRSLLACRHALTRNGRLVICGAPKGDWVAPLLRVAWGSALSRAGSRQFVPFLSHREQGDLEVLAGMLATATLVPPVDRTYPLDRIADAVTQVEAGQVLGKVVVSIV